MPYNVIFPLFGVFIGLLFFVYAGSLYKKQSDFMRHAIATTGVVVGDQYSEIIRSQGSSDSVSGTAGTVTTHDAKAIIEFTTINGETKTVIAKTGLGEQDSLSVNILYLPEDPQNMQIDEFMAIYGLPLFLSLFGAIFWFVALGLRFLI